MSPLAAPVPSSPPALSEESSSRRRFWPWILLASAGWIGYVLSLEVRNPRLVASWHGFLHTAIANRFPAGGWTPENPFFAGEPLRYYWVFHRMSAGLAGLLGVDALQGMRLLTLAGLVLLVVAAGWIGWRRFQSAGAGVLIGYLALAGLNPLGPVIAEARHLARDLPLLEAESAAGPVETVFVSNEQADRLMSRNLLPAMYFSTDWRHGQNIAWFFDISSRGLSLGVLLLLVALVCTGTSRLGGLVVLGFTAALLTALNPIVGMAAAGSLGLALLVLERRISGVMVALAVGVLAAFPTIYQILGQGGASTINPPGVMGLKLVNIGVNYLVLLPLAVLAWRIREPERPWLRALTLAGGFLLLGVVLVHLEEGNEHNLSNAAAVLLAVPAVARLMLNGHGRIRRRPETAWRIWLIGLLFVPVTAGTWIAFDGRPPLPLASEGDRLVRTPPNHPLARLYRWIERDTPPEAVFIINPERAVKMSGNVSELPALTGRTLFTDQPSYLTTPYPDAVLRATIAGRLVEGIPLADQERAYLQRLGRPLYLISYRGDRPDLMETLSTALGPPVFHQDFVAVFPWR